MKNFWNLAEDFIQRRFWPFRSILNTLYNHCTHTLFFQSVSVGDPVPPKSPNSRREKQILKTEKRVELDHLLVPKRLVRPPMLSGDLYFSLCSIVQQSRGNGSSLLRDGQSSENNSELMINLEVESELLTTNYLCEQQLSV